MNLILISIYLIVFGQDAGQEGDITKRQNANDKREDGKLANMLL